MGCAPFLLIIFRDYLQRKIFQTVTDGKWLIDPLELAFFANPRFGITFR